MKTVILAFLMLLASAVDLHGQGGTFSDVIFGPQIPVKPGVSVTVCSSASTVSSCPSNKVTLYTDFTLTTPATNPTTTNAQGLFTVYLPPGNYAYIVTGPGVTAQTVPFKFTISCVPNATVTGCGGTGVGLPANPAGTQQSNGGGGNFSAVNVFSVDGGAFPLTGSGVNAAATAAGGGTVEISYPGNYSNAVIAPPNNTTLYFSKSGTYVVAGINLPDSTTALVTSGIVCVPGVTIQLASGKNRDLITNTNFSTMTGGTNFWGAGRVNINGCILDQNKAVNSSGWALRIYARGFNIYNNIIQNGKTGNVWFEWGGTENDTAPNTSIESWYVNNEEMFSDGPGLVHKGPSDLTIAGAKSHNDVGLGYDEFSSSHIHGFNIYEDDAGACKVEASSGGINGSDLACTTATGIAFEDEGGLINLSSATIAGGTPLVIASAGGGTIQGFVGNVFTPGADCIKFVTGGNFTFDLLFFNCPNALIDFTGEGSPNQFSGMIVGSNARLFHTSTQPGQGDFVNIKGGAGTTSTGYFQIPILATADGPTANIPLMRGMRSDASYSTYGGYSPNQFTIQNNGASDDTAATASGIYVNSYGSKRAGSGLTCSASNGTTSFWEICGNFANFHTYGINLFSHDTNAQDILINVPAVDTNPSFTVYDPVGLSAKFAIDHSGNTSLHNLTINGTCTGCGTNVTVNGGSPLPAPANIQTGTPVHGLTVTQANPSAGNVAATITGTLDDAGLTSSYSGVGACGANTWASTLNRNAIQTCTPVTLAGVAAGVAPSGTFDFSGVTIFKARFSSGLTTTTNGDFGYDTLNKNWHFWTNAADKVAGIWDAVPTNGNCVSAQVSSSIVTLVDAGAPCATGSTASWATITAGTNSNAGTFTATGNTWDFTGATIFKLRTGAGATTSANGDIAYDTTNKNYHIWANGADEFLAPFDSVPTTGNCVKAVVTASVLTLADFGATCGGTPPAIKTNTVNNTTQTILDFTTSTVNAVGLTITPSNPSGGVEKLEVTGASYTGNAATATGAAGTPTLCSAGQGATGVAASFNAAGCTTYAQIAGDLGNTGASPQVTSTHLSSALPVNQGGSGALTFTNHGVLFGSGTSAFGVSAVGTSGQPLLSGGSGANGAYGSLDISTSAVTGLLGVANGGAFSSYTKGDTICPSGSTTLTKLPVGTDGFVMTASAAATCGITWAAGLTNPMSAVGDLIVGGTAGAPARLAVNTSTVPEIPVSVSSVTALSPGGVASDPVTGTTYTMLCSDNLRVKNFNNAGAVAVTLFQANSCSSPAIPAYVFGAASNGAGGVTITPTTSTIALYGASQGASVSLTVGQVARIYTDTSSTGCTVNGCYWVDIGGGSGGSGANTALSNLANPTSINQNLTFQASKYEISTSDAADLCTSATAGCWGTYGTAVDPSAASLAGQFWYDNTTLKDWASTSVGGGKRLIVHTEPSSIHQTGKTASISTATLCASSVGACDNAGMYHIHWDFIETGTACSSVSAGSVTFLLTYTDSNGTAHTAMVMPMTNQTGATSLAVGNSFLFATALANAGASGDYTISTNGSVIQYATTYTACTTGTGTYQLDAVVTRLQ